jgi:hypothetical protein
MRRKFTAFAALCSLIAMYASNAVPSAYAAGELDHDYDWTVRVQTEELQDYFDYKNSARKSGLFPLDRVYIDFYPGSDEKSAVGYEKLFYHDGRPLGLERLQELSPADGTKKALTRGDNIRIRVIPKNKQITPGELKAAANAIMRFWLDAYINKNQLAVVDVPDQQSLQAIANELVQKQKFISAPDSTINDDGDTVAKTTMTLLLESESDGQQIHLGYM